MEKTIKVKSSSSIDVYNVTFKFEKGLASLTCNCKAGLIKQLCKHKINLLEGDLTDIYDKTDSAILSEILEKNRSIKNN